MAIAYATAIASTWSGSMQIEVYTRENESTPSKCLISGACEEEALDCSSMEWFCKNCVSTASYLLNLYSRRLCILQHCIHCLYILLLQYKLVNEYYLIHCSYEDFQVRRRETTIVVNSTEFRLGVTTGLFTLYPDYMR